jgi:perosamine synthetase
MSEGPIEFTAAAIGDEERLLVSDVLDSGFLSNGSMLARFEAEFAERVGSPHAVGVSSGTAALHIAAIAAGVEDGDVVITPTFSFVASANVIRYERAIPLFVDCDPETLNLDVGQTIDAIERFATGRGPGALLPRIGVGPSRKLRAVIPVHIFGRPVDLGPIQAAAERHGVAVIEDACEALGSSTEGVACGTRGQSGVFGFFPNKQITTGEGGMLVTADDRCASIARSLRNQGRDDVSGWLRYARVGFNYRLDEMSAAIGLAQLRKLDAMLAARAAIARRYDELLDPLAGVRIPPPVGDGAEMAWFVYVVRFDEDVDRDAMMARLAARGIGSRPYFWPIHLQDAYRKTFGFREGDFPHAEAAGRSLLALPFHALMPFAHVERVCEAIAEELPACRRAALTPRLARA